MFLLRAVTFLMLVPVLSSSEVPSLNATIHRLFSTIADLQIKSDSELNPPFSWYQEKGTYPSDVRLNFHGPETLAVLRELFSVPDSNMFVTAWVTSCLIEAHAYGTAPRPSASQLRMALDSIDKYRSKNIPYANSIMNFWPQILNQTVNYYQSSPQNLLALLKAPLDILPLKFIEKLLDLLGLKQLEEVIENAIKEMSNFVQAFHIPADFDDTFVNLGLGSILTFLPDKFKTASDYWRHQNTNVSTIFNALKKYAYRPLSSAERTSLTDPRTYFYARDFLKETKSTAQALALVPTWVQDTDEVKKLFSKGVAMPFNINNVDVTVCANAIFGITIGYFSGTIEAATLEDPEIQMIYINTTSLVAHEVSRNFSSRPDLALTYYPSRHECYWFLSRTYAWLNRAVPDQRSTSVPNLKIFTEARRILEPVLRDAVSRDIVGSARQDEDDGVFIDDFLGDNDLNFFNKSLVRGEDRLFSTSVSVAALLNIWTVPHQQDRLAWASDVPPTVKQTTEKAVKWLTRNIFNGRYKPWNAFFSGSGKGIKSMPFPYPANFRQYFNGTGLIDDKFPTDIRNIIGVKGIIPDSEYDAMLKRPHFGMMTPMTFDGYNSDSGGYFPFWSSEAYTYSTALVALSHFQNIV